jgi:hypothetical protein
MLDQVSVVMREIEGSTVDESSDFNGVYASCNIGNHTIPRSILLKKTFLKALFWHTHIVIGTSCHVEVPNTEASLIGTPSKSN